MGPSKEYYRIIHFGGKAIIFFFIRNFAAGVSGGSPYFSGSSYDGASSAWKSRSGFWQPTSAVRLRYQAGPFAGDGRPS